MIALFQSDEIDCHLMKMRRAIVLLTYSLAAKVHDGRTVHRLRAGFKRLQGMANHTFASLCGNTYDACAGPHPGTKNIRQNLEASIDAP